MVGLGASDMKGGVAVMIELAALGRGRAGRCCLRPRVPLLRPRGAAGRGERPAARLRRGAARASSPTWSSCSSRPTTRSTPAASATSTPRGLPRRERPLRPAVAGRERDRRRRRGARAGGRLPAARGRGRRAHLRRGAERDPDRGRDRRQRHPRPGRGAAQLPLRAEPDARGGGGSACASWSAARSRSRRTRRPRAWRPTRSSSSGSGEAGDLALEPKQAWTPVAEFAGAGPRRGQPRPGRDALRAPPRRAGRDRRARADVRDAAAVRIELAFAACTSPPSSPPQGTYPFVRIERAKREAAEAGIEILDFGQGDPREPTDPLIRQALVDGLRERMGYPKAEGLPELAAGDRRLVRAAVRRRARPRRRGDPDLRQQGGDLQLRAAHRRPRRPEGHGRRHRARLPGSRARGARSRAPGSRRCRCSSRTASSRTSTRSTTGTGSRSSGSTTRTTRPARPPRSRSTSAWPGSPREHDFVLCSDEAYTELWFDEPPRSALELERPVERRRLPDALEALVDDRLPLRLRRRPAGDRLGAARPTGPRRARRRRSSSSARRWSPGATRRTSSGRARPTGASATSSCRCSRARVGASPRARRPCTSGSRCRAARPPRPCAERLLAPRRRRRAGLVPRRVRRGLRPDRARAHARGVRARGGDPRRTCCERDRRDDRRARPRRDPRRRARGDDWVVNEEAKAAILDYFRERQMEPIELGPFEYHDKIPLKRDYEALGVRVVPPAVARYGSFLSRGRRDDAELREHRRLGRPAHDDRHVGDGRLVRADRRRRPPRRRRRHRRRARAGQRAARDRRGRRVHRLALHPHRGRPDRRGRSARRRTSR